MMKSFGSVNHAGTHPAVMRAIIDANTGQAVAYGADPWTKRATAELRRLSGAHGASLVRYDEAAWLLDRLVASDEFVEFLTGPAYELIAAVPRREEIAA